MTKLHDFFYKKNVLQQIKGFYYTTRLNSVSEAAKAMNLTQSTVSLQIGSLERDLGFKLLKRESKPIAPTQEGEEFYKMICPLVQEFESVISKFLDRKKDSAEKQIKIAVHHVAISYLMPKIVANFRKNNPEVKIIIKNIAPSDAMSGLKNGELDLIFYPNLAQDPEIEYIESLAYDPILIMNKNHPLTKKEIKSLKDLKDFDLIRIDKGLITLPLFEEAVKNHNLKGSVEFENGNWEMLKHFVKENEFVAIISEVCLDKNDGELVVKNLANLFPKMGYSVAVKKGCLMKLSAKDFIAALNKYEADIKRTSPIPCQFKS